MKTTPLEYLKSLPLPVKAFVTLWILFAIFIPCGFISSIFGLRGLVIPIGGILFVSMLLLVVFLMVSSIIRMSGGMKEAMMDEWSKEKKAYLEVDGSLALQPGERVVFPITPCYIRQSSAMSFSVYPRDVIVTNMRIVPGFRISLLIFEQKETFGQMSLWGQSQDAPPVSGVIEALGANTIMKSISFGSDKDGDYVDIVPDYPLPTSIRIYHPNSKEIFALFSKGAGK